MSGRKSQTTHVYYNYRYTDRRTGMMARWTAGPDRWRDGQTDGWTTQFQYTHALLISLWEGYKNKKKLGKTIN